MIKFPEIAKEVAPKGKRSVRSNKWGNVNGYIGGRFWKTIGRQYAPCIEQDIESFLNGED